jgi:hypothetical protein
MRGGSLWSGLRYKNKSVESRRGGSSPSLRNRREHAGSRDHFPHAAIARSQHSQADLRLGSGASSASKAGQGQDDGRGFDDAGSQCGHEVDRVARHRRQVHGLFEKVAEAEGIEAADASALSRLDRKRKKKTSNEEWKSPADPEAEITKFKDGRTALAYKVEQAVDMETGAIVAVTTHPGAAADSATVAETLCESGEAVAKLIDVKYRWQARALRK